MPLPSFFEFAKDKYPEQVGAPTKSTMCRISQCIETSKVRYCKTIGKFDYRVLMKGECGVNLRETNPIIQSYDYWNKRQKAAFNTEDDGSHANQEDLYVFRAIREKILEETGATVDVVVDTLVAFLYTSRQNSSKKLLWACFGGEIVNNIKQNLAEQGPTGICKVCGKRFKPNTVNQICCGPECGRTLDIENRTLRRHRAKMSETKKGETACGTKD